MAFSLLFTASLKKKKLNYSLMPKLMLCWTFCMFGNLT